MDIDIVATRRRNVFLVLVGTGIVCAFISGAFNPSGNATYWVSFLQNLATEAIGATLVFVLIDSGLGRIEKLEEHRREQINVKLRMGSPDLQLASEAVIIARFRGWLTDGTCKGIKLNWSNLEGVHFEVADLRGADFGGANLQNAFFTKADLRGATFGSANMENANLGGADVRGANFLNAKMGNATVPDKSKFDETTILPDGTTWKEESKFFANNPTA